MELNTNKQAMSNAYTGWYNGVDFKDYFKLRAQEGGSLVFEVADLHKFYADQRAIHDVDVAAGRDYSADEIMGMW